MLAPAFPRWSHSIDLAILLAQAARERADDHTFLIEDIEVSPLHRFDVIVARDPLLQTSALLWPELGRLLHRDHKGVVLLLELSADYFPRISESQ